MKGPWTYRRMKRREDGRAVWVIYRLRDAGGQDVEANREYYTVSGVPAWGETEQGAEHYARVFNAVRA